MSGHNENHSQIKMIFSTAPIWWIVRGWICFDFLFWHYWCQDRWWWARCVWWKVCHTQWVWFNCVSMCKLIFCRFFFSRKTWWLTTVAAVFWAAKNTNISWYGLKLSAALFCDFKVSFHREIALRNHSSNSAFFGWTSYEVHVVSLCLGAMLIVIGKIWMSTIQVQYSKITPSVARCWSQACNKWRWLKKYLSCHHSFIFSLSLSKEYNAMFPPKNVLN